MSKEVELVDQVATAYHLKLAGLPLAEIAEKTGFPSANAVASAIKRRILAEARGDGSDRESVRQLELARLDYVQSRIWPQVDHGDLKAVETFLKISALRARYEGFEQVDASANQNTVLIIGGKEEEYVNKLKELAGQQ
jgi:hypothetical protein